MLLRFSVANFLSFYDKVTFDMFPNQNRDRFPKHIYRQHVPLLKESAIYGPNGSGKSNFIQAVNFFRNFLFKKDFLRQIDISRLKYRLVQTNSHPINMEMEFEVSGKYYLYQISIDSDVKEELYLSGIGEREDKLLFKREGDKIVSDLIENQVSTDHLLRMNPSSSTLSLNNEFPIFNSIDVSNAYSWIKDYLIVVEVTSKIPVLIHMMSQLPELRNFANEILKGSDLNIHDFRVQEWSFDEWLEKHRDYQIKEFVEKNLSSIDSGLEFAYDNRNDFNVYVDVKGNKKVQEFAFSQYGVNGFKLDMDIHSQSDGTVRMLILIPAIYDALYNNKTVFIDEIENSIHPNLIRSIIEYYSSHQSNGQLIYTTHLSKLMDQQRLLRLDEYWITFKEDGQTRMRPLSEYAIQDTIKIENGYLQGRYGGIPNINIMDGDA
ncbi:MAG: AAA family ATPase [Muribaculaceae bacterium]|nr:AAA family ATPase [Muribaculaceae bacterium]